MGFGLGKGSLSGLGEKAKEKVKTMADRAGSASVRVVIMRRSARDQDFARGCDRKGVGYREREQVMAARMT